MTINYLPMSWEKIQRLARHLAPAIVKTTDLRATERYLIKGDIQSGPEKMH